MPTSKEYRMRADECSKLANDSHDYYVQVALTELADEFNRAADDLERPFERNEVRKRPPELRPPSRRH